MATLYPGAQYRPLGPQTQPRMAAHDIICLHTAVGSLAGTDAYFRDGGYGGTESHFGVGHDGTVYQWQDLEHTADANLDGNGRVISIETADTGPGFTSWTGSDVPAWLPAQLNSLAKLIAWLASRYDIPCTAVPDSRRGRRGVGWHRLGIDPWRVPSGERWSTSTGKACPGDRRIAQIPALVKASASFMTVPASPDPAPTTPEDDVSWTHDEGAPTIPDFYPGAKGPFPDPAVALAWAAMHAATARDVARSASSKVDALRADVAALRAEVALLKSGVPSADPAAFATAVAVELAARLKEK